MYKLLFTYRIGLGLIAGVASGVVVYMVYQRHRKEKKKVFSKHNGYRIRTLSERDNVATSSNYSQGIYFILSFFLYITVESYRKRLITLLLCHLYYCILCSILALSGREDVVVVSHGEQMELLNRLDYVLGSITEVKLEVESLRNSLHGLAEDIVGEIR